MGKRILFGKNSIIGLTIMILALLISSLPKPIEADWEGIIFDKNQLMLEKIEGLTKCNVDREKYGVAKTIKMTVTAYSSTPDQTDNDPFTTASGQTVEDGIVANNMLPFGTKVRIPDLYGEKVFVVQDRMHPRKGKYHVDIWFEDTVQAKEFGSALTNIEILEG